MSGAITKSPKTMIPLHVRTVHLRMCQEKDGWSIETVPIYGLVHWQDENGASHYRYLTEGSDELGEVPAELEPYWRSDPDCWMTDIVHLDYESLEDRVQMLKECHERVNKLLENIILGAAGTGTNCSLLRNGINC